MGNTLGIHFSPICSPRLRGWGGGGLDQGLVDEYLSSPPSQVCGVSTIILLPQGELELWEIGVNIKRSKRIWIDSRNILEHHHHHQTENNNDNKTGRGRNKNMSTGQINPSISKQVLK